LKASLQEMLQKLDYKSRNEEELVGEMRRTLKESIHELTYATLASLSEFLFFFFFDNRNAL
jgi:hypothetical protein